MIEISIIMPYYNAAAYIRETVEAIIAQTYKDWELIIVDDCSPAPETTEVLNQVKSMDDRMQDNGYELTCTWYEDANEKLEPYYTMKQAPRQSYKSMIAGCNIGTPGVLFDTNRVGKKYMPPLRRAEDWGLWMNILKDVDYIYTYPKALWKYRHIPGSETSNKWVMLKAVVKMYQTVLKMNVVKAWFTGLFVFLPSNILKKLKKVV